jgi:hypothetical protein
MVDHNNDDKRSTTRSKHGAGVPALPMSDRKIWAYVLVAVLFSAVVSCDRDSATRQDVSDAPVWVVLRGDKPVLGMKNIPGLLISTATPPPRGTPPAKHPFLTAWALDAMEEDPLRRILERSATFDEFVAALRKAGYRVMLEGDRPGR